MKLCHVPLGLHHFLCKFCNLGQGQSYHMELKKTLTLCKDNLQAFTFRILLLALRVIEPSSLLNLDLLLILHNCGLYVVKVKSFFGPV